MKRYLKCFFCLLLLINLPVHAASPEDLYSEYNKEFEVEIPAEITDTITKYNNAKKYVSMYTYVVNSTYDVEVLEEELVSIEDRLSELSSLLRGGYYTKQHVLYCYEDEYQQLIKRKQDIISTLDTRDVSVESIDVKDVPTYSEYVEALRKKNDIVATFEIGDIVNLEVPVQSEAVLNEHNNDMSLFKVVSGTGALSLFNGTVEKVYIDEVYGLSVVVDSYNGVKTYICNLEVTDVTEGDTVYQYQRIGYVLGSNIVLRMSLNDEFVDISKLFEEE